MVVCVSQQMSTPPRHPLPALLFLIVAFTLIHTSITLTMTFWTTLDSWFTLSLPSAASWTSRGSYTPTIVARVKQKMVPLLPPPPPLFLIVTFTLQLNSRKEVFTLSDLLNKHVLADAFSSHRPRYSLASFLSRTGVWFSIPTSSFNF